MSLPSVATLISYWANIHPNYSSMTEYLASGSTGDFGGEGAGAVRDVLGREGESVPDSRQGGAERPQEEPLRDHRPDQKYRQEGRFDRGTADYKVRSPRNVCNRL